MASVKVAVRVRPFNQREKDLQAQLIIQMTSKTTGILNCKANARDENIRYKEFTFDYSYWSHDENAGSFASQEIVYNDLGTEVVECAFQGYNACVFAYGQTGSGKTYTMMGSEKNQGLIPRICKAIFDRMQENSKLGTTHRVQVSYLEIYQERVADLLRGRENSLLKVREHPKKGPYVQGLTTCLVTNYGHIEELMLRGNSHRTTAATNMNDVSSRSHAIFTITFVQAGYCDGVPSETVSKIHLVDLAGSERADATGATGQRLKEGGHINKSLVTLGSVISALAELSSEQNGQRKSSYIPYRDSVLTWLLKDSLGGNSKTIMIAAISPADCNYGETLSTLRYANRAKNIINKPTINEDPNVKLIRELRDEISKLRALMFCEQRSDMLAQLHQKEAREKELTEEWAGKWREAQAILREQRALGLRKSGPGVVLDSDRPHLVAIDDDPLSTGVTLYHLKEGETTIGTEDSDVKQDIELRGTGMEPQHCRITFENGVATLIPRPGAQVMLNNQLIESPAKLSQGCIIFLGKAHVFRYNDPAEAAELRKGDKSYSLSRLNLLSWSTPDLAVSLENLQVSSLEDEKNDIEVQKKNLEQEKEHLRLEQEAFVKKQEVFEKRKKSLEQAQVKLEYQKGSVQVKSNEQNKSQPGVSNQAVTNLEFQELVREREELEKERLILMSEIYQECEELQDVKAGILQKFDNACQFVLSHANDFSFPTPDAKLVFQELASKTEHTALNQGETSCLASILNNVSAATVIQGLVVQHRKELAELQNELDRRIRILCERQKTIESLDNKLINLVDQQQILNNSENLQELKECLSKRTEEERRKIEQKKQCLTLTLTKIHSVDDMAKVSGNIGTTDRGTLSSDTYHTAPDSCSPLDIRNQEYLMSDSGVELKPRPVDESDVSSNEEYKIVNSDSQSSSSIENQSPENKRNRRKDAEIIRRLSQKITLQKQHIVRTLDHGHYPKEYLNEQINILQGLQKKYMSLKYGCTLSPTTEHPLQDIDSPSPIKPLQVGSTSDLYSPPLQNRLGSHNQNLYRSMPSITIDSDCDSIISIPSYCIRGAGSKTHYEYEIRICTVDDRWSILRRYSRFRDLHIAMKARYKDKVSTIPFPPKMLYNTEAVAQSRKRQLELYLRRLLEACKTHPTCSLAYVGPITKATLIDFSPFFRKGDFENGKYGTS